MLQIAEVIAELNSKGHKASKPTIYRALREGKLVGAINESLHGRPWEVSKSDLRKYLARKSKPLMKGIHKGVGKYIFVYVRISNSTERDAIRQAQKEMPEVKRYCRKHGIYFRRIGWGGEASKANNVKIFWDIAGVSDFKRRTGFWNMDYLVVEKGIASHCFVYNSDRMAKGWWDEVSARYARHGCKLLAFDRIKKPLTSEEIALEDYVQGRIRESDRERGRRGRGEKHMADMEVRPLIRKAKKELELTEDPVKRGKLKILIDLFQKGTWNKGFRTLLREQVHSNG